MADNARPREQSSHGGEREGAGAPRGNLNAYKHGHYSQPKRKLIRIIQEDPQLLAFILELLRRVS